jgi:hypothetical protein
MGAFEVATQPHESSEGITPRYTRHRFLFVTRDDQESYKLPRDFIENFQDPE